MKLAITAMISVGIVGALALSYPSRAGEQVTEIRLYAPFVGEQLAKDLIVDSQVEGSCWIGSLADTGRSDAWRCMSGNEIHDPCFSGYIADDHVVACGGPFSKHIVVINLTTPLPTNMENRNAGTNGDPFAIELDDGSRCAMITGATNAVNGMRLNYGCMADKESVYGNPDRTERLWKVYVRSSGDATLQQTNVLVAWF